MSLKANDKDNVSTATSERRHLDICELSPEGREVKEGSYGEEDGGEERGEYELVMAVGHVKEAWMEVPGNLVAHIKVGSSYHLRKEVSFFFFFSYYVC